MVKRLVAAFLSLAFVFATTEPLGTHHCPLHDGVAPAAEVAGMVGHHHMPAKGHSHQCTCLGASCCTAAITAPSERLVAIPVVPVTVVRAAAVPRITHVRPACPDDVLLPPPVGPPTSLSV